MADRKQVFATVPFDKVVANMKIEDAWDTTLALVTKLEPGLLPSKPDFAKLRKVVETDKKEVVFEGHFDGNERFQLNICVGKKVIVIALQTLLSGGGDQKKWRERLVLLAKNTKLATDADVKEWDKKHPDPNRVAQIKQAIDGVTKALTLLKIQVDRATADLKKLTDAQAIKKAELLKLQAALKALGG